MTLKAWRITAAYAAFGVVWIALSSMAVWGFPLPTTPQPYWEVAKGLVYIGITAVLLHLLITRWERRLLFKQRSLEHANHILRDVNSHFRGIIDGSHDLIAAWDADERLIAFNNSFAAVVVSMFGVNPVIGMDMETLFSRHPERLAAFRLCWRRAASGESFTEEQHSRVGEQEQWFEASYAPLRDVEGRINGGFHFMREITERVQMEKDRQRHQALLEQAVASLTESNADLERFAYVASHDLQEPLRAIVCFSEVIERYYGDGFGADMRQYLGFIRTAGQRMRDLLRDTLLLSRSRHKPLILRPVPLDQVCRDAIDTLRPAVDESRAEIEVEPLPEVHADAGQLVMVFQQIIGNAIKFHRPETTPRIQISARPAGHEWEFRVADDGIGFDMDGRDVFEMFARHHTSARYPGTGIGLAICKTIIANHGGRIFAKSAPGQGAAFFFTLPKAEMA